MKFAASMLIHGDALHLPLADTSIDAMVADPPSGIGFMGVHWDTYKRGQVFREAMTPIFAECLRVLKPGAHAFVWALPRTSHWTATALEEAGFEIRDCCCHVFATGFPKSLDVSKAIDRAAGAEREVVGANPTYRKMQADASAYNLSRSPHLTAPATPEARQWDGWGTALKPAAEYWWLVRKPLSEANVAANVLRWGTGALNIDAARIETPDDTSRACHAAGYGLMHGDNPRGRLDETHGGHPSGRWPANFLLSCACAEEEHDASCPVRLLDEQSGESRSVRSARGGVRDNQVYNQTFAEATNYDCGYGDIGGASRFFFVAKPSTAEREMGLYAFPAVEVPHGGHGNGESDPLTRSLRGSPIRNPHPTVKPVELMRHLVRLVCPPGGIVLDPFTGSGTTGIAARLEGMRFIGIDREAEYVRVAGARIADCLTDPRVRAETRTAVKKGAAPMRQGSLF